MLNTSKAAAVGRRSSHREAQSGRDWMFSPRPLAAGAAVCRSQEVEAGNTPPAGPSAFRQAPARHGRVHILLRLAFPFNSPPRALFTRLSLATAHPPICRPLSLNSWGTFLSFFFSEDLLFGCGPCLKSVLNLSRYCFCFTFWLFGHEACGILAPPCPSQGCSPHPLHGKVET